jgi:ferredoxin-NADP reductase
VKSKTLASDNVVTIEVEPARDDLFPPWQPGSHVDLFLPNGLCRQYSLCGRPEDRRAWRFGIARDEASRGGSAYIHDRLTSGDVLTLRGPRNNFPFVEARRYRFIAGGIGITPLLPMCRLASELGLPWALHYGARRRSAMAFVEEFKSHSDHVVLVPLDENGLLDLDAILDQLEEGDAVYCCGPNALIDAVQRRFDAGLKGALHVERFTPIEIARVGTEAGFTVICKKSNVTVEVGPNETILDALERVGLRLPFSCREGTCGTCETRILAGRPDHRDSVLSPTERLSGETMTICVSRSQDPVLVLDI